MSIRTSFIWRGDEAKRRARAGAAEGLRQWADAVLESSQEQVPVAPVGGGYLKGSGKVAVDEGALRAAVGYDTGPAKSGDGRSGGGNLAVVVHENMHARHSTGKAKFLEDPFNASKESGRETVAAAIKEALG